ncbi:MAG: hypothetical protein R2695_20620 [Acidimicrobiales bacterium]
MRRPHRLRHPRPDRPPRDHDRHAVARLRHRARRDRLSKRHFTAATLLGTTYGPEEARDVGFVDRVVPGDRPRIHGARDRGIADSVDPGGFAATCANARQATIDLIRATLDADLATFSVAQS